MRDALSARGREWKSKAAFVPVAAVGVAVGTSSKSALTLSSLFCGRIGITPPLALRVDATRGGGGGAIECSCTVPTLIADCSCSVKQRVTLLSLTLPCRAPSRDVPTSILATMLSSSASFPFPYPVGAPLFRVIPTVSDAETSPPLSLFLSLPCASAPLLSIPSLYLALSYTPRFFALSLLLLTLVRTPGAPPCSLMGLASRSRESSLGPGAPPRRCGRGKEPIIFVGALAPIPVLLVACSLAIFPRVKLPRLECIPPFFLLWPPALLRTAELGFTFDTAFSDDLTARADRESVRGCRDMPCTLGFDEETHSPSGPRTLRFFSAIGRVRGS